MKGSAQSYSVPPLQSLPPECSLTILCAFQSSFTNDWHYFSIILVLCEHTFVLQRKISFCYKTQTTDQQKYYNTRIMKTVLFAGEHTSIIIFFILIIWPFCYCRVMGAENFI